MNKPTDVKTKSRQSFDAPAEPEVAPKLDTVTPAVPLKEPRRFDLNDLPRYADVLYPRLKELFPYINDRMYGGWIRGCISDNACLFLCIDAPDGQGGAACMAFIAHDPLNPVPYVDVLFVLGKEEIRVHMYRKIMKWAKELGARQVRVREAGVSDVVKQVSESAYEHKTVILPIEQS